MTGRARRFLIALPIRVACLVAIWHCYRIALADRLSREPTEESLRAAIAARPNHFQYYWQLSRIPSPESRQLLEKAIQLNPYNAGPMVDLATLLEYQGDTNQSEQLLLRANQVDRTFFPKWSLVNFYLRRDRQEEFWQWARRAVDVGAEDLVSLFSLCHRLESDPATVAARVLSDRPQAIWAYLSFLNGRAIIPPRDLCLRAIPSADEARTPILLQVIDGMLGKERLDDATAVWSSLVAAKLAPKDLTVFTATPTARGFDWRYHLNETDLLLTHREDGLEVTVGGKQAESVLVAERVVVMNPSSRYRVAYRYRTADLSTAGGIRWRMALNGRTVDGPSFRPSGETSGQFLVETGPKERLGRLQFVCVRELGTTRSKGTVMLESVRLEHLD